MLSHRSQSLTRVLALPILLPPIPPTPCSLRSVFQTGQEQYISLYRSRCS